MGMPLFVVLDLSFSFSSETSVVRLLLIFFMNVVAEFAGLFWPKGRVSDSYDSASRDLNSSISSDLDFF